MIMRYLPTISIADGTALPRAHPLTQADFLRQHIRRGWSEADALARYRAWERGELEPYPLIARHLPTRKAFMKKQSGANT